MAACAVHEARSEVYTCPEGGARSVQGTHPGVLVRKALLLPPAAMALTTGCCPPRLCTSGCQSHIQSGACASDMESQYPSTHSRSYDALHFAGKP